MKTLPHSFTLLFAAHKINSAWNIVGITCLRDAGNREVNLFIFNE